jgi:hypothetical protein
VRIRDGGEFEELVDRPLRPSGSWPSSSIDTLVPVGNVGGEQEDALFGESTRAGVRNSAEPLGREVLRLLVDR